MKSKPFATLTAATCLAALAASGCSRQTRGSSEGGINRATAAPESRPEDAKGSANKAENLGDTSAPNSPVDTSVKNEPPRAKQVPTDQPAK